MKTFGEKEKIQITYRFKENPFDKEISWGILNFYVENRDICEIIREKKKHEYEWSLVYLVEWLVNNIDFILGYDPFPFLSLYNDSLNFMLDSAWQKEIENNSENLLWFEALGEWERRHTWSADDDGSCISNVYFYRRQDEIEIAWNNQNRECEKIQHKYLIGSKRFEMSYFKDIILNFLKSIINDFEVLYKENDEIIKLKKRFDFWLYKHDL
jgi:hypothetical protein